MQRGGRLLPALVRAANLIGGNNRGNLKRLAGAAISEGAKKAIAECLARKTSTSGGGWGQAISDH